MSEFIQAAQTGLCGHLGWEVEVIRLGEGMDLGGVEGDMVRTLWGWKDGSEVKHMIALPEDPRLIPSTHMAVHNCLELQSPRTQYPLLTSQVPGTHRVHRYNAFLHIL